jgi:hypothetical protein
VGEAQSGYPRNAELPNYRYIPVSYTANFSGPFGSGIQECADLTVFGEKFAGEHWVNHEMRESIAAWTTY